MHITVQNRSVLYAEAEPVLVPEAVYEADLVDVRRFSNVFGERVGLVRGERLRLGGRVFFQDRTCLGRGRGAERV